MSISISSIQHDVFQILKSSPDEFEQKSSLGVIDSQTPLARMIDHTCLNPTATKQDIEHAITEAKRLQCYAVCLFAQHMPIARELLAGSSTIPICVIDFPEGTASTAEKCLQASKARAEGAMEIDMVLDRRLLLRNELKNLQDDVQAVVLAAQGAPVKVILECSELDPESIVRASTVCVLAQAHFVKTSTGTRKQGATIEDVKLIRSSVGPQFGVKASGGIRTLEQAQSMIQAGANRIGTSSSQTILST
ncbi:MAG: deoxyribose-phosphate aldolase [Bdellovibrionota bacterium]